MEHLYLEYAPLFSGQDREGTNLLHHIKIVGDLNVSQCQVQISNSEEFPDCLHFLELLLAVCCLVAIK